MRDWSLLLQRIQVLRLIPIRLPDNFPSQYTKKAIEYNAFVFEFLETCLTKTIPDDQKENALYEFLIINWRLIKGSSLDYTFNPTTPTTLASLAVAQCIKKPDESLLGLLMPTITNIIGIPKIADVNEIEQYLSMYDELDFNIGSFLTASSGEVITDLDSLFQYAANSPERLFGVVSSECFSYSAEDLGRIRISGGEASMRYFDELERQYRLKKGEKPSIGHALRQLQRRILKSSMVSSGSDTQLDFSECADPVRIFHQAWIALGSEVRDKIKIYKAKGGTLPLESFLLVLFAEVLGISAEEINRVEREGILPCTHYISGQLELILQAHPELMEMPLAGYEQHFENMAPPSEEQLSALTREFSEALVGYPRTLVGSDLFWSSAYSHFVCIVNHFSFSSVTPGLLKNLGLCAKTVEDVSTILSLLHQKYWRSFLIENDAYFAEIFKNYNTIRDAKIRMAEEEDRFSQLMTLGHMPKHVFSVVFNSISVAQWSLVFEILANTSELKPFLFSPKELGMLLHEMPVKLWGALRGAIGNNHLYFISSVRDLCTIWDYLGALSNGIFHAFENDINSVLHSATAIGVFCRYLSPLHWDTVFQQCRGVIAKQLRTSSFLPDILRRLQSGFSELREINFIFFAKFIAAFPEWKVESLEEFSDILHLCRRSDWPSLFRLVGGDVSKRLLLNLKDLERLLKTFSSADSRLLCIKKLRDSLGFISMKQFDFLELANCLRALPECENDILLISRSQLVDVLSQLFTVCRVCKITGDKVPQKVKSELDFLLPKILMVLLRSDYIFQAEKESISSSKIDLLQNQFLMIEKNLVDGLYDSRAAVCKKIGLLADYIAKIDLKEKTERSEGSFLKAFKYKFGLELVFLVLDYLHEQQAQVFNVTELQKFVAIATQTDSVDDEALTDPLPRLGMPVPLSRAQTIFSERNARIQTMGNPLPGAMLSPEVGSRLL